MSKFLFYVNIFLLPINAFFAVSEASTFSAIGSACNILVIALTWKEANN